MITYAELINDLGKKLNIDIYADLNNIVTLMIEKRVKIQIEIDSVGEFLILGAYIAELPPGKFREHILKNSLRVNYLINERPEILSYMNRENMLTLHRKFMLAALNVDELITQIKNITIRAKKWQDAIESGLPSPDDELPSSNQITNKSIFGL